MKLDVLVLAPHPDDTELCCGGTLASLVNQGKKVGVVDFTKGEMGTRGTPELRMKEANDAAEIIGLEIRENLGLPDTQLTSNREYQKKIIQKIRAYQPHVCLIAAPDDRHPDHRNASRLTTDAIFYSGLTKIETQDEQGKSQPRWRPSHVIHFMQDRPFQPDFIYDISDTFEKKIEAVLAFGSQFNVTEHDDEPETYISNEQFFKGIEARARHYGHLIGAKYGEPFKYHNGPVPMKSFGTFFETDPDR